VARKEAFQAASPLDMAVEYIDAHLGEELSVRDLASAAFVSTDHLTRLFKKKFGLTVSEYIQAKRIHLAAQLLSNKEMTVSAAARSVGFSNYSYFTEQFKRIYQVTPREYQKRMLEEQMMS
jgi:AraC-like DNA-binding protein